MSEPLVYYSTNTLLAYNISQKYYRQKHFVWCTPHFEPWTGADEYTVPDSSSPKQIFKDLYKAVCSMDKHNLNIRSNRLGLRRGVAAKRETGMINDEQAKEILAEIKQAESGFFRPFLYVIPYLLVKDMIIELPPRERANPLSVEYKILELPRDCFDRIEYGWR
jgi:hypothetical protein